MAIDETGVFKPGSSTAVQPLVPINTADPIFYAQQNAAAAVGQSGQQVGRALTARADVLQEVANKAEKSKNATDALRMSALRDDYMSQMDQMLAENANDPAKWSEKSAQLQSRFGQDVGKLKLSPEVAEREAVKNELFWTKQQRSLAGSIIKYSAARDRETVTFAYNKLIEEGEPDAAAALVTDPAYSNIWSPGQAERMAAEASDRAAAHETKLIQSSIQADESVSHLESIREDIDNGEFGHLNEIQQNTLKASIENRSRELRYSVQGKNISQQFKFGAQGQWLTDEELEVGVSNETYSQEDADLYKLTRDNAFQAEQEQASEQRKAAIKEQRKVLISQDRDSEAYKSMKTRAGKLLLNVFEDSKDADIVAYEDLMNEISTTDALITPEARVELLNIVLRARSVDIQDGEIDKAGSWFDMKLEEDEIAFRNDFYGRMSELAKTNPIVSEAGTEFMKAESAIHNLFTREEPPTDEEKEEFMVMVFQPLFNLAAVRKMRGQQ